jgi:hypothetical protein
MTVASLIIDIKLRDTATPGIKNVGNAIKETDSKVKGITTSFKRLGGQLKKGIQKFKMLGLIGLGTIAALFMTTPLMTAAFKVFRLSLIRLFMVLQVKVLPMFKRWAKAITTLTRRLKESPMLGWLQTLVAWGIKLAIFVVFATAFGAAIWSVIMAFVSFIPLIIAGVLAIRALSDMFGGIVPFIQVFVDFIKTTEQRIARFFGNIWNMIKEGDIEGAMMAFTGKIAEMLGNAIFFAFALLGGMVVNALEMVWDDIYNWWHKKGGEQQVMGSMFLDNIIRGAIGAVIKLTDLMGAIKDWWDRPDTIATTIAMGIAFVKRIAFAIKNSARVIAEAFEEVFMKINFIDILKRKLGLAPTPPPSPTGMWTVPGIMTEEHEKALSNITAIQGELETELVSSGITITDENLKQLQTQELNFTIHNDSIRKINETTKNLQITNAQKVGDVEIAIWDRITQAILTALDAKKRFAEYSGAGVSEYWTGGLALPTGLSPEAWAGVVGGYQAGGIVPRTGLIFAHAGERVIPARGETTTKSVNITVDMSDSVFNLAHESDIDELTDRITRRIAEEQILRY